MGDENLYSLCRIWRPGGREEEGGREERESEGGGEGRERYTHTYIIYLYLSLDRTPSI